MLRDHEEQNCVVLEAEVRTFRRPDPVCLRYEYPMWHHDPTWPGYDSEARERWLGEVNMIRPAEVLVVVDFALT